MLAAFVESVTIKDTNLRRRGKPVHPEQTMAEMAEEVLSRQARTQVQRTGQSHASARADVTQTPAGCQLEELRSGAHQHEEVRYWQANLLFGRVSEQAGHPV
jgi:hypothetical protein